MKKNDYNKKFDDRERKLIASAKILSDMNDEDLKIFCEGNSPEDRIIIIDKAMKILIFLEDYERCEKLKKLKEKL